MFMDNIPYDDWCEYLKELLGEHGVKDGIVLDLGCGTGNITSRLSKSGYDMIGIDNAEDMLSIAMEKAMDEEDCAAVVAMVCAAESVFSKEEASPIGIRVTVSSPFSVVVISR